MHLMTSCLYVLVCGYRMFSAKQMTKSCFSDLYKVLKPRELNSAGCTHSLILSGTSGLMLR